MLNKIIQMSLANRLVVLVGSILLIVLGFNTISKMEVDVFPDLSAPTVVVMTEAEGMAPEEVERMVTFPIETVLNGATDVRRVRSSSTTGFSVVWVEFDWGTDIYLARQIVAEKLAVVGDQLPEGVGEPILGPQSSILGEVMIVGLTADSATSLMDLRTMADWTIRPRLLSVGGVSQVSILGGDIKEYQINLDPLRMKHYGVTLEDVLQSTEGLTRNASGGTMYAYGNEYIVRCLLSDFDVEQLGHAVVKYDKGESVLLENVANVKVGAKFPKLGVASDRAKSAVLLTVTKQPNTGTIELTENLERTLADLQKNLPSGVRISTDIFKQSTFIESSIDNVKDSLFEGGLLVVIVLFLFLMNMRTTVISLVTIPLSVMITFVVLKTLGFSINTMSLGGVAIAIGSLVDDAIVDVENIYKRLRENALLPQEQQISKLELVFNASKEVRMPILNSTLIIVATFLPLFFLSGMEGRMLVPLGISFVVSLFASTLVALSLTPVLCSYLLKPSEKDNSEPVWVRKMKELYKFLLERVLAVGKPILIGVSICFLLSIILFCGFGRSFLPSFNEGSFTINVNTIPGVSLDESDKIGRMAEEALLSVPEIITVGRKTGRSELDEHALGVNVSELEAPFVLKGRSKSEVEKEVRKKLNALPGVNVEIGSPISHRIDAMLSGTRANVAIKLFGDDLSKLYEVAGKIKNTISKVDGVADLMVEQQVERPQLKITPRREMLVKYGVTIPAFSTMVETLLSGKVVSNVYEGNNNYELVLRVDSAFRGDIHSIKEMLVDANGSKVPFHDLANVVSSMGPNTINRENVARRIVISANVVDRDLRGVVTDIQNEIEEHIKLPEGYYVQYGGQFESEQAASRIIMLASIFSILLIFGLLYREFKEAKTTMVVLLNLPLALIGGVISVALMGGVISIPALIGFISLFGIATRNGMLLIDRYDALLASGMSLKDSVLHGSIDRLNPILMTALTSGLALIPLALGGDLPGNEIQSPMAKVILGGLISSTFLNGFVIPVSYMLIRKK